MLDWNSAPIPETHFPRVDVIEHEKDIDVQAALPGFKKEDVEVSIKNQIITIRAFSKEEKKEEKKGNYFRKEIHRGEFQRILTLPDNVDDERATAVFKEGMLTVSIPKTEQTKQKTIRID